MNSTAEPLRKKVPALSADKCIRRFHVFAAVILLAGCSHVQETVGPTAKATTPATTDETPAPSDDARFLSTEQLAAKADVPIYPGASLPEGASSVQSGNGQTRYEIVMSTVDHPAAVLKFYAGKLQHAERIAGDTVIMGMSPKGRYVKVSTSHAGSRTDINAVATDETKSSGG